jgi:hypothetical protein
MLEAKVNVPSLECPEKNPIVNICTQEGCRSKRVLRCIDEDCRSCGNSEHDACSVLSLKTLTKKINERIEESRLLMTQLIKKEKAVLHQIKIQQMEFI